MGFMEADEGTISWQQETLTRGSKVLVEPALRRFSIVFQEYVLLPHLNVFDNVALGLVGCERSLRQKKVHELLALLHLTDRAGASVDELSGGEQQRVALARALVVTPRLLLLDEPFSNMDKVLRKEVSAEVRRILKERGVTTILVTHDHQEAFYFSDSVHILHEGRLVAGGSPREIYYNPTTSWAAAFVGEVNRLTSGILRTDLGWGDAPELNSDSLYLVRPEGLQVSECGEGVGNGWIVGRDFVGPYEEITVKLRSGSLVKVWDFQRRGMTENKAVEVSLVHSSYLKEVKQ